MSVQGYPRSVHLYKGEGRILIIPSINHIGGYSVDSDFYSYVCGYDNYFEIGRCVLEAFKKIDESPLSNITNEELKRMQTFRNGSKYKTWLSFWKHNLQSVIWLHENGELKIFSTEKLYKPKGGYCGCIKEINITSNATSEEIGKAVLDVFQAAEEYHTNIEKENKNKQR